MNVNRWQPDVIRAALLAGVLPLVACDNLVGNGSSEVTRVIVVLTTNQLIVGQTTQATAATLSADGKPLPGHTVTWESTNPAVASISASGTTATITAADTGTAIIIATSEGISGMSPTLVVSPPPNALKSFTVSPETIALTKIGATQVITTTLVLEPGATADCQSVSNNTAVVTVTPRGANPTVTAVWPGGATIIISCTGSGPGLTENLIVRYVSVTVID